MGDDPQIAGVPGLLLDVDFEDDYGSDVIDASGNGYDGKIVNHGTPGMAGHEAGSNSLRLNYDQLVSPNEQPAGSRWQAASITIPSALQSGLYVVHALFEDEPTVFPQENPVVADRYQCIAIHPPAPAAEDAGGAPLAHVAVILPVNTWTAYNGWPSVSFGSTSAHMLPQKSANRVGNNSAYETMGDFISPAHYHGWRRPNLKASPYAGNPNVEYIGVLAQASVVFLQWLESAASGIGVTYHVYTDWDLDLDETETSLTTANYPIWITLAHHEYWSETAMDRLDDHLETGGNLLNVGGNLFLWRADLDQDRGVMEVRKWPNRLELQGPEDGRTLIGDRDRTGCWRFLCQCMAQAGTGVGDPMWDYSTGTPLETNTCDPEPTCYGEWYATAQGRLHWLWRDERPPSTNTPIGTTGLFVNTQEIFAVGHETDTRIMFRNPAHLKPIGLEPGVVEELADAMNIGNPSTFNWTPENTFEPAGANIKVFEQWGDDCDELTQIGLPWWRNTFAMPLANFPIPGAQIQQSKHATITHYETMMNGRVVSVPATAAPWVMGNDIYLTALVKRALICMRDGGAACMNPPGDVR